MNVNAGNPVVWIGLAIWVLVVVVFILAYAAYITIWAGAHFGRDAWWSWQYRGNGRHRLDGSGLTPTA